MDQLSEALSVAVSGEAATAHINAAREQIRKWGITMPTAEPLVLDFGLGRFNSIGEIEFWIANEQDAGYCGKFLYLSQGQSCPKHMHKEKLETFFIVKGVIEMTYEGSTFLLKEGATLRVETHSYHKFSAKEPSLILEVSKPSVIADNYFEDRRIPIGGNFDPKA